MEASLCGGLARTNKAKPLLTTLRSRRRQRQCASAPFPRSNSLVARALRESGSDNETASHPWLGAVKTLSSRATALSLAALFAASSASALPSTTSATTLTPPRQQQEQQLEEKKKSKFSSLVISGQIDYDRVARARSAVEKRKKRETTEEAVGSSPSMAKAAKRSGSSPSELPSPDEADALLQFDRDAYTDDAWEAMKT